MIENYFYRDDSSSYSFSCWNYSISLLILFFLQNDIDDVVGVFFSVDADEEKHILYEKTEVLNPSSFMQMSCDY